VTIMALDVDFFLPSWARISRALRCATERQWVLYINFAVVATSCILACTSIMACDLYFKSSLDFAARGGGSWFHSSEEEGDVLLMVLMGLSVLGLAIMCTSIFGAYAASTVSLSKLVSFFWLIVFLLGPFTLFGFFCFDFQDFIATWIQHRWDDSNLKHLRMACCKKGTAEKQCKAPVKGGINYTSVDAWCEGLFNQTDGECVEILENAQTECFGIARNILTAVGVVSYLDIILLLVCLYLVDVIVTHPVILKTANDLINFIIAATATLNIYGGLFLRGHKVAKIENDMKWVGKLFVWSGWINLAFILIGLMAARIKSMSDVWAAKAFKVASYVYVVGQLTAVGILGTGLAAALVLMAALPFNEELNNKKTVDRLACEGDLKGCSFCDEEKYPAVEWGDKCPEWDAEDVIQYIIVYLKLAAFMAVFSICFCMAGLYYTYITIRKINAYKWDLV